MVDEATDFDIEQDIWLFVLSITISLPLSKISLAAIELHESIESSSLLPIIKDVFLCVNLRLKYCHWQYYDGGSNMAGIRSAVAKQLLTDKPWAVFTHCYGHAPNLAVGDTVKKCKLMRSCLYALFEITKIIKKSPKHDAIFHKLKEDLATDTSSFCVLCLTRWTVRAASLQSVLLGGQCVQHHCRVCY